MTVGGEGEGEGDCVGNTTWNFPERGVRPGGNWMEWKFPEISTPSNPFPWKSAALVTKFPCCLIIQQYFNSRNYNLR